MKRCLIGIAGTVIALCIASAAYAEAGYKGGFFVKNDEGTFNLKMTGRVQPMLYFTKESGVNPRPNVLSFRMRRALISVNSTIHEKVSAGFTLMHALGNAAGQPFQTVNVTGATVSVEVIPEFVVTAGMVGLPLDMMTETSSKWFLLTEAPITSTQDDQLQGITQLRPSFGTPDGLGVNLSGGYWKWFYSASVVNVNESNWALNPSWKFSYGFRTGFNILDPVPGSQTDFEHSSTPQLTVSAGTMYQGARASDDGSWIRYLWTSSGGVALRWVGVSFTAEGYYRQTRIPNLTGAIDLLWARTKYTDIGYYAAIGYYIIPKKFEVAGLGGQIIRQGPANDSYQFGGGLNYYVFDNNFKVQLAYTLTRYFNDATGAQDNKIHNIALLTSAAF